MCRSFSPNVPATSAPQYSVADGVRLVTPTQPGEEFFQHSMGGMAQQLKAIAQATDIEDLFIRLEASGQMLRIDRQQTPTMFQPGKIVPQLLRAPMVTFSAAVCAYVEAHHDDATKNKLCTPVPFPRNVAGWVQSVMSNMANQVAWTADKSLRNWMRDTRLDGFGKLTANLNADEGEKLAILADVKQYGMGAMENAKRLLSRQ